MSRIDLKSVCHIPEFLYLMNNILDWHYALNKTYMYAHSEDNNVATSI